MVTDRRPAPTTNFHLSTPRFNYALSTTNTTRIFDFSFVKKGISIESVARYFGGNRYKADSKTCDRIRRCIDTATILVSPKATYTIFPVSHVVPGREIVLENGSRIMLPEYFDDPGIHFVATAVGTLGEGLEKHCRNLAINGKVYTSTLFDAIGTVMLDLLGEKICETIEEDSCMNGLARGARFIPGIDGYPLEQQHLLFQLADNESVSVFLNSSAVMMPAKSISFFTALTSTPNSRRTTNKCSICRLPNCQYRKTP